LTIIREKYIYGTFVQSSVKGWIIHFIYNDIKNLKNFINI